ncbi:hypothetical protein C489_05668 [Natrinema versiforme JCM 10478]|uniref:Uncharacterized protein n=2 Tax=Natrinema versiforme TaxID=88724 RepID=L9Y416_9EURY|nr:hypothetical protein C489_05668 [Natrinema versiforme JCM 10478]
MNALRRGERTIFVAVSKVIVLVLFILLAGISAARGSPIVASLAGVGVFVVAAVLLPVDALRDTLEWFTSGKAGEWAYGGYLRIMPGRSSDDRRGRGQATLSRLLALALTVALVSSLLMTGIGAAQEDSDDRQCATVVHDGYLDDESYVSEFDETASIQSDTENIRTSLEQTDAFVRLKAENPNAYCVDMTVKVHPDIITPADVGELSDTDGDVESTWRNTHDFDRDQSYTEITFRMEPESEVTFAPNRVRVLGVAWKDSATDPSGIFDRVKSTLGEADLEQRTYTFNSSEGAIQTVPLQNDDGKSIDEWQASYRVGDGKWRPITTDSSDPAFYRTVDSGEAVQFHFDTDTYDGGEVEVEFVANPNGVDKATHNYRSYRTSWSDVFNFNFDFLSTVSVTAPAAEVSR